MISQHSQQPWPRNPQPLADPAQAVRLELVSAAQTPDADGPLAIIVFRPQITPGWVLAQVRTERHGAITIVIRPDRRHARHTPPGGFPAADSTRYPFTDPVAGQECELVVTPGKPLTVAHPGCKTPADVSTDLDAFYGPACHRNGRVSGAWCHDMAARGQS